MRVRERPTQPNSETGLLLRLRQWTNLSWHSLLSPGIVPHKYHTGTSPNDSRDHGVHCYTHLQGSNQSPHRAISWCPKRLQCLPGHLHIPSISMAQGHHRTNALHLTNSFFSPLHLLSTSHSVFNKEGSQKCHWWTLKIRLFWSFIHYPHLYGNNEISGS